MFFSQLTRRVSALAALATLAVMVGGCFGSGGGSTADIDALKQGTYTAELSQDVTGRIFDRLTMVALSRRTKQG